MSQTRDSDEDGDIAPDVTSGDVEVVTYGPDGASSPQLRCLAEAFPNTNPCGFVFSAKNNGARYGAWRRAWTDRLIDK